MTQLDLQPAPVEIGEILPPKAAQVPAPPRPRAPRPVRAPESEGAQVLAMIAAAVRDPAIDVMKMTALFDLREKVANAEAKRAFNAAVADAKGEIGPIFKDKVVDFTTQKGRTNYRYEGFDSVARQVDPVLNRYGLSYRYRAKQEGQKLTVICILSHRDGYSEETELSASEDHSGNKNGIQAVGSAATFLQRYTLKLALGLAATTDDDGRAASGQDAGSLTEAQLDRLQLRLVQVGANVDRFLDTFGAPNINEFPAKRFDEAMRRLDEKERRERQGARQ